ncbi:hypothetical protein [Nannocystis pusilla]|uniref:Uncharacterized protein n=1 Tax=Nannocystis pusilla TaxID=889268 RepID=A0ABS7TND1_9BACT|nr:hypothetical protein [Nannocystis pusilla]MBZ5709652.1 hypothetical protein [Nannocystis pusilla]
MNTVVARVLRVLTGQSPIALVHAIDELGHEHKLELPAATVRGVTTGHLLVLQWSLHAPPGLVGPTADTTPAEVAPRAETGNTTSASQLEALLGLSRGT